MVETVPEALARFQEFLRREGHRVTRARLLIAEAALRRQGHFTVLDLWDSPRGRGASVATVYRTLELLAEAGLVRRCSLAGTAGAVYETLLGRIQPHGHLVCRRCGRVAEFGYAELEGKLRAIAAARGFTLEEVVIQGVGLCPACQREARP
ncbi:MAG: Fur family transcriptional regulator [Candidatus Bipolaricaulaceae bacterium]